MVDESFESLACALACHTELSTDDAPGQSGSVGSERSGLDPAFGFPSRRRSGAKLREGCGVGDGVGIVGVGVKGGDDGIGLGRAEVSWVLLGTAYLARSPAPLL